MQLLNWPLTLTSVQKPEAKQDWHLFCSVISVPMGGQALAKNFPFFSLTLSTLAYIQEFSWVQKVSRKGNYQSKRECHHSFASFSTWPLSLNQFNFSRLMKGMGECVGERDFNLEGVDGGNVRAHERAIKWLKCIFKFPARLRRVQHRRRRIHCVSIKGVVPWVWQPIHGPNGWIIWWLRHYSIFRYTGQK